MRKKRLAYNFATSLIYQITTIVCGIILPRQILQAFGSNVNGLVNSVTQFLNIITFLELGVGAVVQSALYKPLAENDDRSISEIMVSAQNFYHKIATILLCYVLVLIFIYPQFVYNDFDWGYSAGLIVVISISLFAQYYFGIVDILLLNADQHGYINYLVQTIALILNTAICVLMLKRGVGIHLVKLTTSVIFLIKPVIIRIYVNRHYCIDRKIQFSGEPIKQKWNGIAQHIAAVVIDQTDNVVLTIFSTLSNVSIYSVYHLIVYGIKQLIMSTTNGMQALLGELWAKQESEELHKVFQWFEWLIHMMTVLCYGCTIVLILPFVKLYTEGITDANYIQPLFSVLIVLAHAGHCLRLPYNIMILAAGHYKQTQNCYIIAAIMNLSISILTVKIWGLVGVAIGTIVSMFYQTVWMVIYNSRNLIHISLSSTAKLFGVDVLIVLAGSYISKFFVHYCASYYEWFVMALITLVVWAIIMLLLNAVFYREKLSMIYVKLKERKMKKRAQNE